MFCKRNCWFLTLKFKSMIKKKLFYKTYAITIFINFEHNICNDLYFRYSEENLLCQFISSQTFIWEWSFFYHLNYVNFPIIDNYAVINWYELCENDQNWFIKIRITFQIIFTGFAIFGRFFQYMLKSFKLYVTYFYIINK